jgi:hypothetical protein
MADIETAADRLVGSPAVTVYTKASLATATPWTEQPHLRCEQITHTVNGIDAAQFTYEVGPEVRRIGATQVEAVAEIDLIGDFVKVVLTDSENGNFEWHGYVVGEVNRRQLNGPQPINAVGLQYFLDRNQIRESVIYNGKRVGRVVPFNNSSGANGFAVKSRGNRSSTTGSAGVYEFASSETYRAEWTVRQIIDYLIGHFHPNTDIGASFPCEWEFSPGAFLDDYIVSFDPAGKTIYEILNGLVNQRRSLCWWLKYSEVGGGNGTATIYVAPLNDSTVTLPGGGELPANPDQYSLSYDDDASVSGQSIETVSKGSYKAVRTQGARITTTFTARHQAELDIDWTSEAETAYKAGASGTTGYGGLDTEEQQARNDAYRREEQLYRVYQAHRIPADWDGEADGEKCFPVSLKGGSGDANLTFHTNWLRILPRTLLARGNDYSTVASITKNSPEDTGDDLLPVLVLIKTATSPDKYQYVDKLTHPDFSAGTKVSDDIRTSYSVSVQQDCPGILLRASNGMNHMLAKDHWTGASSGTREPELDYEDLLITCSVEMDHYAEGLYPDTPASGFYEELLMDVGDQYRLDYLVPSTVIGHQNGDLVTSDGGVIRDDRDQLNDIARFAFEWYRTPKRTLSVQWAKCINWFDLGWMITEVGDDNPTTLNTVIGEITYNFHDLTTSIRTIGDQMKVTEVI